MESHFLVVVLYYRIIVIGDEILNLFKYLAYKFDEDLNFFEDKYKYFWFFYDFKGGVTNSIKNDSDYILKYIELS